MRRLLLRWLPLSYRRMSHPNRRTAKGGLGPLPLDLLPEARFDSACIDCDYLKACTHTQHAVCIARECTVHLVGFKKS